MSWLILPFLLAGCSRPRPTAPSEATSAGAIIPPQPQKAEFTVGVTLLTRAHEFYKELEEGLRAQAGEENVKLVVFSGEWNLKQQLSQVQDLITKGVDAIVVCPVNSKGVVGAIKEANRAGIPVFTADIAAQGGEVISHIASDNRQGGRLAGEYLAKLLEGKGKVIILDQPTVTSVIDRVAGFLEAVEKYPGIEIVGRPAVSPGTKARAKEVTDDVLQAHPDLDAIFGSNDDCALGALRAAEAAGREDLVIIGYDATQEARAEILKGGPLKADVIQYPRKIGQKTIEVVARYLRTGEKPDPWIPIEVGIIDQAALQAERG